MDIRRQAEPARPERKVYEAPGIAWEEQIEINQIGSAYSYCETELSCTSQPKAPCNPG